MRSGTSLRLKPCTLPTALPGSASLPTDRLLAFARPPTSSTFAFVLSSFGISAAFVVAFGAMVLVVSLAADDETGWLPVGCALAGVAGFVPATDVSTGAGCEVDCVPAEALAGSLAAISGVTELGVAGGCVGFTVADGRETSPGCWKAHMAARTRAILSAKTVAAARMHPPNPTSIHRLERRLEIVVSGTRRAASG